MKPLILTIRILAWTVTSVLGQNKQSVVIGTMISRPNAVLIINPPNKNQGFLLPQLTTAGRLSIAPASPQTMGKWLMISLKTPSIIRAVIHGSKG